MSKHKRDLSVALLKTNKITPIKINETILNNKLNRLKHT